MFPAPEVYPVGIKKQLTCLGLQPGISDDRRPPSPARELSPHSHDVYVYEPDDPSCYVDSEALDHVEKGKK